MFQLEKIDQWFFERHGRFTASEIWKILGNGSVGKLFSATAMTYIKQKAIETMTALYEKPEIEEVKSLLHGKVYEQPAFEAYVNVSKNYSMKYFGTYNPIYLSYNEHSGGSPDGIMGEDEKIIWALEIKCPKNSNMHFDYLQFKSQWDLKERSVDYYSQIQFLLMITKAEGFHFCSFDERFRDKSKRIKIIDVLPDEKFQNNLDVRLQMAIKERDRIISEIND